MGADTRYGKFDTPCFPKYIALAFHPPFQPTSFTLRIQSYWNNNTIFIVFFSRRSLEHLNERRNRDAARRRVASFWTFSPLLSPLEAKGGRSRGCQLEKRRSRLFSPSPHDLSVCRGGLQILKKREQSGGLFDFWCEVISGEYHYCYCFHFCLVLHRCHSLEVMNTSDRFEGKGGVLQRYR